MARMLRCGAASAGAIVVALTAGCTFVSVSTASHAPLANGQWVRVVQTSVDASTLAVIDPASPESGVSFLTVPAGPARESVKMASVGDTVRVELASSTELKAVSPAQIRVTASERVAALIGGALLVILPVALIFRRNLRWVLIGEDNRYSASKFQLTVWTLTVLSSVLGAVLLRVIHGGAVFAGGVEVPTNVLMISGLSVVGFAGAKQIVVSKLRNAAVAGFRAPKPPSFTGSRFPRDLVTDDSGQRPDLGDIQMLLVVLIAAGTYLVQTYGWLGLLPLSASVTLPDIGGTMLALFGAGHAAYLGKKLSGDTGATAAPGPATPDLPPKPPM